MSLTPKAKILLLLIAAWFTPEIFALVPYILAIGAAIGLVGLVTAALEFSLIPRTQ